CLLGASFAFSTARSTVEIAISRSHGQKVRPPGPRRQRSAGRRPALMVPEPQGSKLLLRSRRQCRPNVASSEHRTGVDVERSLAGALEVCRTFDRFLPRSAVGLQRALRKAAALLEYRLHRRVAPRQALTLALSRRSEDRAGHLEAVDDFV